MKKITMTLVILLGLTMGAFAQDGGLFGKGATRESNDINYSTRGGLIDLPGSHGDSNDHGAPLGSGIVVLAGLGAAYLVSKKNREE